MKNEFVPYDIAFEMGNLGYDIPCFRYYSKDNMMGSVALESGVDRDKYPLDAIRAPLYQQAFRWFRDELKDSALEPYDMVKHHSYNMKVSWEEAQDACLRKLIEIVKEKRDGNT